VRCGPCRRNLRFLDRQGQFETNEKPRYLGEMRAFKRTISGLDHRKPAAVQRRTQNFNIEKTIENGA
jgi:hypothetical protein